MTMAAARSDSLPCSNCGKLCARHLVVWVDGRPYGSECGRNAGLDLWPCDLCGRSFDIADMDSLGLCRFCAGGGISEHAGPASESPQLRPDHQA